MVVILSHYLGVFCDTKIGNGNNLEQLDSINSSFYSQHLAQTLKTDE